MTRNPYVGLNASKAFVEMRRRVACDIPGNHIEGIASLNGLHHLSRQSGIDLIEQLYQRGVFTETNVSELKSILYGDHLNRLVTEIVEPYEVFYINTGEAAREVAQYVPNSPVEPARNEGMSRSDSVYLNQRCAELEKRVTELTSQLTIALNRLNEDQAKLESKLKATVEKNYTDLKSRIDKLKNKNTPTHSQSEQTSFGEFEVVSSMDVEWKYDKLSKIHSIHVPAFHSLYRTSSEGMENIAIYFYGGVAPMSKNHLYSQMPEVYFTSLNILEQLKVPHDQIYRVKQALIKEFGCIPPQQPADRYKLLLVELAYALSGINLDKFKSKFDLRFINSGHQAVVHLMTQGYLNKKSCDQVSLRNFMNDLTNLRLEGQSVANWLDSAERCLSLTK